MLRGRLTYRAAAQALRSPASVWFDIFAAKTQQSRQPVSLPTVMCPAPARASRSDRAASRWERSRSCGAPLSVQLAVPEA